MKLRPPCLSARNVVQFTRRYCEDSDDDDGGSEDADSNVDLAATFRSFLENTLAHAYFWKGHTFEPRPQVLTAAHLKEAHYFAVTLTAKIAGTHQQVRKEEWLSREERKGRRFRG